MNRPLTDDIAKEWWSDTHGSTGTQELEEVVEIEADCDDMEEDCFDDKDEY